MISKKYKAHRIPLMFAAFLLLAAGLMLSIWRGAQHEPMTGMKQIVIEVTTPDATEQIDLATEAEFLGEALRERGLIEGEEGSFGLYITSVNGIRADESAQQWWCITKGGEAMNTGADATPIADGERYEFTLTAGY